jgi:bifunctional DNA-binding transcriptional regulator/antitoxin component of YhaV-PrlF toxin-antitoxin module
MLPPHYIEHFSLRHDPAKITHLRSPSARIVSNSPLAVPLDVMETTRLSREGQVIIPETLRNAQHWETGQELIMTNVGDGILLQPKKPFPETALATVAGCLKYSGPAKSLADFDEAIRQGVMEQSHDRS